MAFIVLVLHHRQWELIWCLVFVPSINPLKARSASDLFASLMGLHPNVVFKNITNIYGKAKGEEKMDYYYEKLQLQALI